MRADSPDRAGDTKRAQRQAFEATSLSASLTVSDLRKSVTWYRDVLGFTVHHEYERGGTPRAVALTAGTVQILLGQDDGAKGLDRVKGEGFSLRLTTAENVDAVATRIQANGGALDTEPAAVGGARAFRLRDPDGFRLTISSERAQDADAERSRPAPA